MVMQMTRATGASFLAAQSAAEGNREDLGGAFVAQTKRYDLLESYYSNTVYRRSDETIGEIANWQGLPKELRPLLTAPKVAVDWWSGHVYRHGNIPFSKDVDPAIIKAWNAAMVWGGWANSDLHTFVRYGANLGDVFAEVEVNDERQKVYPRLHHPRYVVDLELNSTGDVICYQLNIPDWDFERKTAYNWGKRVTKNEIVTFYDDREHGYHDMPSRFPNPYGFVPAVWVNHASAGDGFHGASCLEGVLPLIDELNGLRASINDYIHRFAKQPVAVVTEDAQGLLRILGKSEARANNPGDAVQTEYAKRRFNNQARESTMIIPLPPNSQVIPMIENLGLGDAEAHLMVIKDEIEQALPEITLTRELRGMDYVSDPGARTLVEDGEHKLNIGAANYDHGIIRLAQMTLSIGGEIRKSGQWTERTKAQELFAPFDLSSYANGKMEIAIDARHLIQQSISEKASEAASVEALETDWGREHAGLSEEERQRVASEKSAGAGNLDALLGRALGGAPAFGGAG